MDLEIFVLGTQGAPPMQCTAGVNAMVPPAASNVRGAHNVVQPRDFALPIFVEKWVFFRDGLGIFDEAVAPVEEMRVPKARVSHIRAAPREARIS